MVNKKISTPPSVKAGVVGNASSSTAGGSTIGSSVAGGGILTVAPPLGSLPTPTMPGSGFRKEVTLLVSAFGSSIPAGSNLQVNGQQMSQSSIIAALQAVLALFAAVDASVQTVNSNRLALKAALPVAHQFVAGLKAGLIGTFGKGNPVLVAFGFSGNKPHALTVEQKSARKAKAKATRELRGTLGSRQKLAVKFQGQVQVQTSLSGTQTGGGNTSPAGSSSAGATATPAASGNASGSGSTSSGT